MKLRLKLWQSGLTLVLTPILLEICFVGMLSILLLQVENELKEERLASQVMAHIGKLSLLTFEASLSLFRYSADHNEKHFEKWQACAKEAPPEFEALSLLLKNKPEQLKVAKELEKGMRDGLAETAIAKSAMKRSNAQEIALILDNYSPRIYQISDRMSVKAQTLADPFRKVQEAGPMASAKDREKIQTLLWAVVIINLIAAVGVAVLFSWIVTSRLSVMKDNSDRLATGRPINPPVEGDDEVAEVDKAFHQMARELSESSTSQRAIIENAKDVICSIDSSGRLTSVNSASIAAWGHMPEDLIGKRLSALLHQDDIESAQSAIKQIQEGKSLEPFEARVASGNGTEIPTLWSAIWNDTEKSLFCVAHDITQRKSDEERLKLSEERTRSLIESMPVGVMILTNEGKIISANRQAEQIFDQSLESLCGRVFTDIVSKETSGPLESNHYEKLVGSLHRVLGLRNDKPFPIEVSFNRLEGFECNEVLAVVQDITERQMLEEAKSQFFRTIRHDLRAPLMSLAGSFEAISTRELVKLDEKGTARIHTAVQTIDRLRRLLDDLLNIERVEGGPISLCRAEISTAKLVQLSVEAVRSQAEQQNIQVVVDVEEAKVSADHDYLIRAIVNLLSNAIKFSNSNSKITIKGHAIEGQWHLSVIDNGRGIPTQFLPTMFEKFQQVDRTDGRQRKGSGLGLAIVKAIVEAHDGTIGVNSEEGHGSTFWMTIPIRRFEPSTSDDSPENERGERS